MLKNVVRDSICTASFLALAVKTIALIVVYYAFSISLVFYQQWFIKGFHYPLSVVVCHLVVKFILAAMCRAGAECFTKKKRVTLGWNDYVKKLLPTGACSSFDIGLSNWSFEFITVSLYTMTKSSCIIFILAFAILFKLEKFRWSLLSVIITISIGLFLFTYKATQFNLEGFIMVLLSSLIAGCRWTLAQLVTQKDELGLSNPVDMVYHVQPWMIITLLPAAIIFEGVAVASTSKLFREHNIYIALGNAGLTFIGGLLAFLMEVSEYLLLSRTSSLTLSIAGIMKEICTLLLANTVGNDKMNFLNAVGLVVSLSGITLHIILKAIHSKEDASKRNCLQEKKNLLTEDYDVDEDEDVLWEQTQQSHF